MPVVEPEAGGADEDGPVVGVLCAGGEGAEEEDEESEEEGGEGGEDREWGIAFSPGGPAGLGVVRRGELGHCWLFVAIEEA